MAEEFNLEQQVVIATLRQQGVPNPEAVVRADRVTAALVGAYMVPIYRKMVAKLTEAIDDIEAIRVKIAPREPNGNA